MTLTEEYLLLQKLTELSADKARFGALPKPAEKVPAENPACGDSLNLYILLDKAENKILKVHYDGEGCALSRAAAALLTKHLEGKSLSEAKTITPGTLYDLIGVQIAPARANCALLPYGALESYLKNYV